MEKLSQIIGQETALAAMKASLPPAEPASAYLFVGPTGVGKMTTALAWTRALMCSGDAAAGLFDNESDDDVCGVCGPCVKIEKGSHPDLHIVKPETRDKKVTEEIDIVHIRELTARLAYKPYEAERAVAIIDGADKMNLSAANAFLKTLEEPPGDTVIILIASNLNSLLPTIISRCRVVRFRPVAFELMVNFLSERLKVSGQESQELAALAKGSPGAALGSGLEEKKSIRDEAMAMIANASADPLARAYRKANELDKTANRKRADLLLPAAQEIIRDMIRLKITGKYDNLVNMDLVTTISEASARFSCKRLMDIFELVEEMKTARKWNINPLLVYNLLLLEMKE